MPTWESLVYLAVVLDVFSRRIVGWAITEHMRTQLVTDAMALHQRHPVAGVIHRSDKSSTPRSPSACGHDQNKRSDTRADRLPGVSSLACEDQVLSKKAYRRWMRPSRKTATSPPLATGPSAPGTPYCQVNRAC